MQKHRPITLQRLEKYIQTGQYADVNLSSFLVTGETSIKLSAYAAQDLQRITFKEAVAKEYTPIDVGHQFGPTWSSHWVRAQISVPKTWTSPVLIFDSSSEAMIWSSDGEPLQGLTGGNNGDRHVDYNLDCAAGTTLELYIEVACNGMFGAGNGGNGSINPPVSNRYFTLETAKLVQPNDLAYSVLWDFEVLIGLAKSMEAEQIGADALSVANEMVNTIREGDSSTLQSAKTLSMAFFDARKKTGYSSHVISAVGNCHIDTAWLWPYDETKRKIARSFATQCRLLEKYPDYIFTASQAVQFEWLQELYPKLFAKVQQHVKTGRFIPIGGTYVEMDCNIPSGEALCRQFLHGQRYFLKEFGVQSTVFWLPDTFGYAAQLPQIIVQSGLQFFFTQKLSWNNINKFPHSSFYWKGLDGTSVLTHFSPADTYTAQGTVAEAVFAVKNNKDKMYSNQSLLLYGNGDGGGGPLIPMIERLQRMKNLEGLPATVEFQDPNVFYERLSRSKGLNTWQGELYFELHRGTYTTHAIIKKYNRLTEYMLRRVEMLYSLALVNKLCAYPTGELDRLWKLVLLNQFHDVLPGSSIGMVYIDALKFYEDVIKSASNLESKVCKVLSSPADGKLFIFNENGWTRKAEIAIVPIYKGAQQMTNNKTQALAYISELRPMGFTAIESVPQTLESTDIVKVNHTAAGFHVENSLLSLTFNQHGHITSIYDKTERRESIDPAQPANVFRYFEDIPLYWDAWDVEVYHLEKHWLAGVGQCSMLESGPLRVVLTVTHPLSAKSSLTQHIIISANSAQIQFENEMNWNENRKILKVEFPVLIKNDVATFETQFGYIQRPTHFNNSWDLARFEVCAHKFVDYSEYGYGMTLYNDWYDALTSKYGFSVKDNVMRMSIVRAPKSPDDACDIGLHKFRYAIEPHQGGFNQSNAVQKGYEFQCPITLSLGTPLLKGSLFQLKNRNIVLDTIKKTQDQGNTLVLRFYEAYGGRGEFTVESSYTIVSVNRSSILENKAEAVELLNNNSFSIAYTPFQIITLLVSLE